MDFKYRNKSLGAPDEWDRLYNVDFFIKIKDKYMGLQIKPAGFAFITQMINERKNQEATHKNLLLNTAEKFSMLFP